MKNNNSNSKNKTTVLVFVGAGIGLFIVVILLITLLIGLIIKKNYSKKHSDTSNIENDLMSDDVNEDIQYGDDTITDITQFFSSHYAYYYYIKFESCDNQKSFFSDKFNQLVYDSGLCDESELMDIHGFCQGEDFTYSIEPSMDSESDIYYGMKYYTNNSGTYYDPYYLAELINMAEMDYVPSLYNTMVRASDNGMSGYAINGEIVKVFKELRNNKNIEFGKSKDGYNAIHFTDDVKIKDGLPTDNIFYFPKDMVIYDHYYTDEDGSVNFAIELKSDSMNATIILRESEEDAFVKGLNMQEIIVYSFDEFVKKASELEDLYDVEW